MRIAILVLLFPPKVLEGTEVGTYNIAKHLAKRGHKVHVVTSLDRGLPKESIEEGFYLHRIGWWRVRFLGIMMFWLKTLVALRKINPDIVHAQGIDIGIPSFLSKKFLKKPYVVWGQGSDVYLPWLYEKPICKFVLKHADAVIALTQDMKQAMQKICRRDVLVIPSGIDLESFQELPTKQAMRGKLDLSDDDNVILFVGRLCPVKGLKYLVQAMNIVRDKESRARLLLVGYGEERQSLEQLVKELDLGDRVTSVGKVPNEKVPEYMTASDIFVLPSLSEGFPLVSLEAMASGLPIVATKVGGLPEIVEEGENGFLVEPKNPAELAEKILLLLRDDELRERISRNNKEKAKDYSWESVVDQLEMVYRDA